MSDVQKKDRLSVWQNIFPKNIFLSNTLADLIRTRFQLFFQRLEMATSFLDEDSAGECQKTHNCTSSGYEINCQKSESLMTVLNVGSNFEVTFCLRLGLKKDSETFVCNSSL